MNGTQFKSLRGVILDRETTFTVREISHACGVERSQILTMLEEGVIDALPGTSGPVFHGEALVRARRAVRLVDDLGVNWPGAALALRWTCWKSLMLCTNATRYDRPDSPIAAFAASLR